MRRVAVIFVVSMAAGASGQATIFKGSSSAASEVVRVAGICSGVYVSDISLLTASHCFAGPGRTMVMSPERPGGYTGKLFASGISGKLAMVCAAAPTERVASAVNNEVTSGVVSVKGYGWFSNSNQTELRRSGRSLISGNAGDSFTVTTSTTSPSVPCSGDSGGPAFTLAGFLVGVAEGYPEKASCGEDHTYTIVTKAIVNSLLASTRRDCQEWVAERTKSGPITDKGPLADKFRALKPGS
jgi:hypothetical protein